MKTLAILLVPIVALAGEQAPPTEEAMQAQLGLAVREADRVVISEVVVIPGTDTHPLEVKAVPAWDSIRAEEIAEVSRCVRFRFPPPSRRIVDGEECWRMVRVGGWPTFVVTLKKTDRVLVEFAVWRGLIGGEPFGCPSVIGVDERALQPFYQRVTERLKANQVPEPTSGSVTPRAASSAEPSEARDARVAPSPPVAHR